MTRWLHRPSNAPRTPNSFAQRFARRLCQSPVRWQRCFGSDLRYGSVVARPKVVCLVGPPVKAAGGRVAVDQSFRLVCFGSKLAPAQLRFPDQPKGHRKHGEVGFIAVVDEIAARGSPFKLGPLWVPLGAPDWRPPLPHRERLRGRRHRRPRGTAEGCKSTEHTDPRAQGSTARSTHGAYEA